MEYTPMTDPIPRIMYVEPLTPSPAEGTQGPHICIGNTAHIKGLAYVLQADLASLHVRVVLGGSSPARTSV